MLYISAEIPPHYQGCSPTTLTSNAYSNRDQPCTTIWCFLLRFSNYKGGERNGEERGGEWGEERGGDAVSNAADTKISR